MEATADAGEILVSPTSPRLAGRFRRRSSRARARFLRWRGANRARRAARCRRAAVDARRVRSVRAAGAPRSPRPGSSRERAPTRHRRVREVQRCRRTAWQPMGPRVWRARSTSSCDRCRPRPTPKRSRSSRPTSTPTAARSSSQPAFRRARDDDEGRAACAPLGRSRTSPHRLPLRIGVHRGHVFAGEIGTTFRATYTVMGDTVNLAARLMAAASENEIYASPAVLDRSRTSVRDRARSNRSRSRARPSRSRRTPSVPSSAAGRS